MAHLDPVIHFSRTWPFGERSNSSHIFLRDRACRPLADERMAASHSPGAFRRANHHAGDLRGVGDPVLAQHNDARGSNQVVKSVHRSARRHRFQVP